MLSLESLKTLATKWQTHPVNVSREYVQHVFLSCLYRLPESDALAFKGGTALRLLYGSPRFSEDLDFTGGLKIFHLQKLLKRAGELVREEALPLETLESKPTSGGCLALYSCQIHGDRVQLELNVSLRSKARTEPVLVATPLYPAYQCLSLPAGELVKEKIEALFSRKKARDFFDLYFVIRQRLGMEAVIPHKKKLIDVVKHLDAGTLQRELKIFLPVSHHKTIANLPQALSMELNRL